MDKVRKFILFIMSLFFVSLALAAPAVITVFPDSTKLKWQDATNLPKGAKLVILIGDPNKKQFYTALLKLPAHFMIPAHAHITDEYDTVISGIYYMGMGAMMDKKNVVALTRGSFTRFPAAVIHYGFTKKETIIEVSGIGPWGTIPHKLIQDRFSSD